MRQPWEQTPVRGWWPWDRLHQEQLPAPPPVPSTCWGAHNGLCEQLGRVVVQGGEKAAHPSSHFGQS